MTIPLLPADAPLWSDLRRLAGPAVTDGPAAGVGAMVRAGLLDIAPTPTGLPPDQALALATLLRRLGRADLVMARLFEGHVNALKLIALHGTAAQRDRAAKDARAGRLLGVWGAEGERPAVLAGDRLTGAKRFCSGLGVVARAVVPVRTEAGAQLVLVDADVPARMDPAAWTASAMRASVSGGYDMDGLAAEPLGPPGVYATEPYFEGGIWRYCAAHVGGAEALVQGLRDTLAGQGRDADPVQAARIARATMQIEAARRMVEGAAVAVEGAGGAAPDAVNRAVALALLTREQVEDACLQVIALTERALGMAAHDGQGAIDRIRRDLSLFLRQANPDGKLAAAARLIAAGGWRAGETW